ncbi:MAG: hypothetical protein KDA80_19570 [Planctomycetaceae bacterium]|nr:hypothetical protein [Planctomycetaceae bacterium]
MSIHETFFSRKQTIAALRQQIQTTQSGGLLRGLTSSSPSAVSTGCTDLDALFPAQGVRLGSLVEWLETGPASGAGTVSLLTAREVCPSGRALVLIDSHDELFPWVLKLWGFDLSRLVIVRPHSERDALWVCEESLRCEGVGLVWANLERLTSLSYRRLQLAAEASAGVGFLLRSSRSVREPTWADARLRVHPLGMGRAAPCFRVEMADSGGRSGKIRSGRPWVDMTVDRVRGLLHGISEAANPLSVVS